MSEERSAAWQRADEARTRANEARFEADRLQRDAEAAEQEAIDGVAEVSSSDEVEGGEGEE